MVQDYSSLYDREIYTVEGPGGEFSMYRDNHGSLRTGESLVEEQVTATLAKEGFPELYAAVGPADAVTFEPSWASTEEEESGDFPGAYSYVQWGMVWSRDDEAFSATFKYYMQPLLVNVPKAFDLSDAVFEAEEECVLTVREW